MKDKLKKYETIEKITFNGCTVVEFVPFEKYVHLRYFNGKEYHTQDVYYDDVIKQSEDVFTVYPRFRKDGKNCFTFVEQMEIVIKPFKKGV